MKRLLAGSLMVLLAIGCGEIEEKLGMVAGLVTYKGEPFSEAGLVFFDPTTGNAASFSVDSNGEFAGTDPMPLGSYRVTLGAKVPTKEDIADGRIPSPAVSEKVHPMLQDPAKTPLVARVKEGENRFEFEIHLEVNNSRGPMAPPMFTQ